MSDFPRLKYMLEESTCDTQSGHEPVRASNGALRMRRMFTGEKRNWILSFLLDNASRTTLQDHYDNNKDGQFSFYWKGDAATYTASYATAPQFSRVGPEHTRVRVQLMER